MTDHLDRAQAESLDADDELREFRERFVIDDELVYLNGNSLGRLPKAAEERLSLEVSHGWGQRLVQGWRDGWLELPVRVGDLLGAELLGAQRGQVVVGDSTTVCFYKLASAALDLRPGRTEIVTDRDNFPSDRYVLEGLAESRGLTIRWLSCPADAGPGVRAVADVVGPQTALVSFSHVEYRSGYLAPMSAISRIAADAGALTLWDLSHSVGSVPISLDADGADFAVGCTYKYLCGGPGAPGFMYARASLHDGLRQPIQGWLGRSDPFTMGPGYEPAAGVGRLLSGTPPVLALSAVHEGVRLVASAGIDAIRQKGTALTSYLIDLFDARLAPLGVRLGSPRDPKLRGAHVSVVHSDASKLCSALIERGVIPDFRGPDIIRIGLSPLYTRFTDVWDGVEALRDLLAKP